MASGKIFLVGVVLIFFMACHPVIKNTKQQGQTSSPKMVSDSFALASDPPDSDLLRELLAKLPGQFSPLVQNPGDYRLQVIYSQIDRDTNNKPFFRHHYFNVTNQYTYPASIVKLPASVLALEKLNRLGVDGLGIHSHMFTDPLRPGEKAVFEDTASEDGKPSVGNYVKKILLVSDNDAHNRLYEFLGQEPLNNRLHQLGFSQAQITHRLSMPLLPVENRVTNPVWFMGDDGRTIYRQPYAESKMLFDQRHDSLGKGYMEDGGPGKGEILVNSPFDFSLKNRWPLKYAHLLTQWIMFPETQPADNRLLLSVSDYHFLWKYMAMFPGESDFPNYPDKKDWPAYVKYLVAGGEKGPWPYHGVRVFNKTGTAYGFLLDAAYVADFENKVEFMLSAVVYCNKDGVLNDDKYDYDEVGYPFFKALGLTIYNYERARKRNQAPDLSTFRDIIKP